jgi:hypothetical protein
MSQEIFTLCKSGDEEGVRRMIATDRAVVHARDTVSFPYPYIYLYVIIHGDPHFISHLYYMYIQNNNTTLHRAAYKGHTAIVQLLLQEGPDKDAKDIVSRY